MRSKPGWTRDDAERVRELEAIVEALFQVTPWMRPSTTEAGVALQRSIAIEQIGDQCGPALDAIIAYMDKYTDTSLKRDD